MNSVATTNSKEIKRIELRNVPTEQLDLAMKINEIIDRLNKEDNDHQERP